jgi:enoyl-CoA hydratase/carnithine racemase
VLNALSLQWWSEFTAAVREFDQDDQMRVGILTGSGRAFSAGRDLKELAGQPEATGPSPADRLACSRSPKPFICAVNGLAAGAGLERALDCDIRIASTNASFALPEPRWGLIAATAVRLLPHAVPFGEAMYLLLTGNWIDAATAVRIGLVHEVVAPGDLMETATGIAAAIAGLDPRALTATKRLAYAAKIGDTASFDSLLAAATTRTDQARLRLTAFTESRDGAGREVR